MPLQFPLPPDTRATGTGSPAADMDQVIDTLNAMGATLWVAPTGDATGAQDTANVNAALAALPSGNGRVRMAPGNYYWTCGSVAVAVPAAKSVWIQGAGRWATIINAVGTGDLLNFGNTDPPPNLSATGGLLDFTLDGISAGAGSVGLRYGNLRAGELRIAVQNFSGAGSVNVLMQNQYAFTEETHGYLWLTNGTQNLVFDVASAGTTSTNSFGYTDLIVEILAKIGQDGVVLQNGAFVYSSKLSVRANFQGSGSAQTNAVLRITGAVPAGHPNAGGPSKMASCRLDVQAECSSALGSNAPQTIVFGTLSSNAVLGCLGVLDFAQGSLAFATSNWTATGATGFVFDGVIRGDFNLNNATVGLASTYAVGTAGARTAGKAGLNAANGNLQVNNGDYFSSTLAGNITVSLNPGGAAALGGAQRKVVVIKQAAAGGPFTVAWPHTGSPSVTACTVNWAGGSAPVMTAGANAVDVYYLDTYDGATWFGRASQNVS